MRKILVVIICLGIMVGITVPAAADLLVQEADLNPDGTAYEVNPDQQGGLWISDYWAGEVWYVDSLVTPTTYTAYSTDTNPAPDITNSHPADAHRNGGYFWWVDGYSNFIGQALVNTGEYTLWQITNPFLDPQNEIFFYGMAIDASGRLWASDGFLGFIYSLSVDISNNDAEVCTYILPDDAQVSYLVYHSPYLWLGDAYNSRLLRINLDGNYSYSSWQLPDNSAPFGMAVDGESDLWYADTTNNSLLELDPDSGILTRYDIPTGAIPQMVTVVGNEIWFTGRSPGMVGKLDSTSAGVPYEEIIPVAGTLTPTCGANSISPYETGTLAMTTGNLNWSTDFYPPMTEDAGWNNYQMPANSAPWGIAFQNQKIWVVDSVRNKLVQVVSLNDVTPNKVFLPLIKR